MCGNPEATFCAAWLIPFTPCSAKFRLIKIEKLNLDLNLFATLREQFSVAPFGDPSPDTKDVREMGNGHMVHETSRVYLITGNSEARSCRYQSAGIVRTLFTL